MKSKVSIILLGLSAVVLLALASCGNHNRAIIDRAYQLVETHPDSALRLLRSVGSDDLGDEEARYALVYTIAQDKSGVEVCSDSLMRKAYTYYNRYPDDSLYAKCQYYMGEYYALNDSTERAVDCLTKAIEASKRDRDPYTQCLALSLCSKTLNESDPAKAIKYARQAVTIYDKLPNAKIANKVYYLLDLADALLEADSLNVAQSFCEKSVYLALRSKDPVLQSEAYQDLSLILRENGDVAHSLKYAKLASSLVPSSISKALNLASTYLEIDSFNECERLLGTVKAKQAEDLFTVYYLKHILSMKRHGEKIACIYADSAYSYIGSMYEKELSKKEMYYSSYAKSQYEEGVVISRNKMLWGFLAFVALLAVVIIVLVVYSYLQYKDKVRIKILSQDKERQLEEQLHEEEMKHKEVQLSTMRGYILKKIDVAQKLAKLREMKQGHVELANEDWEEIRVFLASFDGDFVERLQKEYPNLHEEDIRLMMLLRLKMSAKTMALVYGISEKSIRQKLFVYKSKVGIEDKKISLREFIEAF